MKEEIDSARWLILYIALLLVWGADRADMTFFPFARILRRAILARRYGTRFTKRPLESVAPSRLIIHGLIPHPATSPPRCVKST